MDKDKWLTREINFSYARIVKDRQKRVEILAHNGTLKSGSTFGTLVKEGVSQLEIEINEIVTRLLSSLNLSIKEIDNIETTVYKNIDDIVNLIIDDTRKLIKNIGLNVPKSPVEAGDGIKSKLQLLFEAQRDIVNEKQKEKRWEYLKLIISALLGGIVAFIIQKII